MTAFEAAELIKPPALRGVSDFPSAILPGQSERRDSGAIFEKLRSFAIGGTALFAGHFWPRETVQWQTVQAKMFSLSPIRL
jgi:hypothetical protein